MMNAAAIRIWNHAIAERISAHNGEAEFQAFLLSMII